MTTWAGFWLGVGILGAGCAISWGLELLGMNLRDGLQRLGKLL